MSQVKKGFTCVSPPLCRFWLSRDLTVSYSLPFFQVNCSSYYNRSIQFSGCNQIKNNKHKQLDQKYNCSSKRFFHHTSLNLIHPACVGPSRFNKSNEIVQGLNRRYNSWESIDEMITRSTKDLVGEILEATKKVDVMTGCVPTSQVQHLVEELQRLRVERDYIQRLLSGQLWLLQRPEDTVALCRLLLDHGMSQDLITCVVHDIPHTYRSDIPAARAKINETLMFLRNYGFTEHKIFTILSRYAAVLFVDESRLRTALARIKSYFPVADTMKIVCTSPNIFCDDWSSVRAKINYCIFVMGYIQSDLIKSQVFSHSLQHIQDRHVFLQRAGVFQIVNKKLHPSLNANPPLKQVIDSSNSNFVNLVEGVNVRDYLIFQNMREIEREMEDVAEDEEEEEYDEDDEIFGGVLNDVNDHKHHNVNYNKSGKYWTKKKRLNRK